MAAAALPRLLALALAVAFSPQPAHGKKFGASSQQADQPGSSSSSGGVTAAAEPGAQLQSLDDDRRAVAAPLGINFLRIGSRNCRRCLKSCLGGKIQNAQVSFMRIQAPLSLVTWYLFKNRPFSMMPLDQALARFFGLPPAIFAGVAGGAYMSCRDLCDLDCPYPGGTADPEDLPELDEVEASDTSFLSRLYQRPAGKGGGGGGGFAEALSQMFAM